MSTSDKPSRNYREWLRKNGWPFQKREREREGADSVMPHLEEFLDQSRLLDKPAEDPEREKKVEQDKDKPPH